jgi:hypothetical protein
MNWTADKLLDLARSYQPAMVLAAAADLDLFTSLAAGPLTAPALAHKLRRSLSSLPPARRRLAPTAPQGV